MKHKLKTVILIIILFAVGFWILDKVPFNRNVNHEISANIYEDGVVIGHTTVFVEGEKSNYLFRQNDRFYGMFYIKLLKKTSDRDLQTCIKWSNEENVQQIKYFKNGQSFLAEDMGIVPYLLINSGLTKFAIMCTDNTVIATSDDLYELYTKHISWDSDTTSTFIAGAEEIPQIN
jgi:hypothetical protein